MRKKVLTFSIVAVCLTFTFSSCGSRKSDQSDAAKPETTEERGNNNGLDTGNEDTNELEDEGAIVGEDVTDPSADIVDNALTSGDHSTLVSLLNASGLTETLKGKGPFTVFAPTDAAFDRLPEGMLDKLMKPGNKAQLVKVLTYHVVQGTYTFSDLKNGQVLKTVGGEELKIGKKDSSWSVNGVQITTSDVVSSNGIIHVIEKVLMPKKL